MYVYMLIMFDIVMLHWIFHLILQTSLDYEVYILNSIVVQVWLCNWPSLSCKQILGSDSKDADSDEEWPALGEAGAGDSDAECDTEVVVDPDDEKAIQMFMNKNPPMRQDTT